MNTVQLIGRLAADVEFRHTPNGTPVANFSLAVQQTFKNKTTGEYGVDFVECQAWRGTAEFLAKNFEKGTRIAVVGSLRQERWTDTNTGSNRSKLIVTVNSVHRADAFNSGKPPEDTEDYSDLPM